MMKKSSDPAAAHPQAGALLSQGCFCVALFMALGLTLEGLVGLKIPAYLGDPIRRELFTLAHTHGTLFGLLLMACALALRAWNLQLPRSASASLRTGSLLMPLAFLAAGIRHPEGDPGPAIWLAPLGGLLMIYGMIQLGLQSRKAKS